MVRVYFGESLGEYGFGQGHSFGPDRIHAFWKETTRRGLDKKVDIRLPRTCKPEIILFQAGADSIKGDPITDLEFSPNAHHHAAKRLCAIADEFCQGRIIAMGGDGYNRNNLALAWNTVTDAMLK